MAMERHEVKYILQAALERLNRDQVGTATWGDVYQTVKDARERKVKESLTSIVGSYSLADLSTALSIAEAEQELAQAVLETEILTTMKEWYGFSPAAPPTVVATPTAPNKSPVPKKRKQ